MSPLYDRVAQLEVKNVMKEWRGQRGPKVNEASHVKAAQWAASEDKAGWIESYQDLLYLETLQSIVAALEEEGRPEFDASVWMSLSSLEWFFDHYNRLQAEQMKGMAFTSRQTIPAYTLNEESSEEDLMLASTMQDRQYPA
ncbi:hypothetical protein DIPPA_15752 [Diplonema papillatum]|nr:hypothetical protein DIPPA_15752 [Diplonema papillatum]